MKYEREIIFIEKMVDDIVSEGLGHLKFYGTTAIMVDILDNYADKIVVSLRNNGYVILADEHSLK